MRVGSTGLGAAIVMAAAVAVAGPVVGPTSPDRIDPFLRDGAPTLPMAGAPDPSAPGPRPAVLRLDPADADAVPELEGAGLVFRRRADGSRVELGGLYPVDAPIGVLRHLAAEGWALTLARPMRGHEPTTAVTGPLSELDSLVASGSSPVDGPLGQGMTVLDVDSSIDLFHPHFFRADGGVAIWFDADGDGVLTPGIDGIDRNNDGELTDDEILQLGNLRQMWTDLDSYAAMVAGDDDLLDPARDWLWLDSNTNGVRDFGPMLGFDDDDPAFGERIYAPEDLDGNGLIEVPERLLRLGSSRVVAVTTGGTTFRRGENLTDTAFLTTWRIDHATAVGGILVGGQLYPQPRVHGFLPEADLYLFDRSFSDTADWVEVLDRTSTEGVDVMLHEYGSWVGRHLDGSSPMESGLTTLSDAGIAQICPAGNLGTSGKHGFWSSDANEVLFHFRIPTWLSDVEYLWLDLHSTGPAGDLSCAITSPHGATWDVDWAGEDGELGELSTWGFHWTSDRDTSLWTMTLYGAPLDAGTWVMRCTDPGAGGRDWHAYLSDGSSWGRGTFFLQEQDTSNMTHPSTADVCTSVAAFAGSREYYNGERVGERHLYSGVGPRINGGKTVDVAATADPFAPIATAEVEDGANHPAYRYFSGTSGAGPHVTAAAVLLTQLNPDLNGEEIRELLRDGARVDAQVEADADSFPDDAWGYGKLSAYRSAYDEPPPEAADAPVAVVAELVAVDDGDRCLVTATGLADGVPDATFRWDVDYDGDWDTEFVGAPHEFAADPGDVKVVRVQAAAGGWWIGGTSLIWTVDDPCPAPTACSGCSTGAAPGGATVAGLLMLGARRRRRG